MTVVTNKDLSLPANSAYLCRAEEEVKERFGLADSVVRADVTNAFQNSLSHANAVLDEIWYRTVTNSYGNMLPFGRLWDEVLGLTRFVASFYSVAGRKGELIQTHYFVTKFGERIQCSGGVPQVDYYLLPTVDELLGIYSLSYFPNYSALLDIANSFTRAFCEVINVNDIISLSKFNRPFTGRLNTEKFMQMINTAIPHRNRQLAIECFNTFDKGPLRTIIFLLLLDDIRQKKV